jgi:hypothetical protein
MQPVNSQGQTSQGQYDRERGRKRDEEEERMLANGHLRRYQTIEYFSMCAR